MATQHPIPGQLSSLLSLHKLLFCQAHVDVLKQQHGILAPAPASWGTNAGCSTFVTEFSAELLGPLVKVQSVHKMVFRLPSAFPCLGASTSSFSPVEKYVIGRDISPVNPDK